jgi:membrane-bound metal-dependent hydrolase YbcI (DUF457 family)
MAQTGLHGIVGAYVSRAVVRGRKDAASGSAAFGFVLGSILPDADFFAVVAVFPFNPHLAANYIHRTFSHSLIVITAIMLIGLLATRRAKSRALVLGLGAGMLAHVMLDILIWFSGVDLLWPLGFFGLPSKVNLWSWVRLTALEGDLLAAADYAFLALFLGYLSVQAKRLGTDQSYLPVLSRLTWILVTVAAAFVVLAVVLPEGLYQVAHYGLFTLVFLPAVLYSVFRMRNTISARSETT